MSFTHLLKRSNGYYYFRIRVPSDLADKIPAREIVKSLKTTDRTNAKTLLRTWQHKTEKAFMLLRADFLSQEQEAELIGKLLPKQFQITQKAHLRLVAAIDEYIRVIKKGRIMRLFFSFQHGVSFRPSSFEKTLIILFFKHLTFRQPTHDAFFPIHSAEFAHL